MIRVAIYFTPAPDSLIGKTAASWLGRDIFTSECHQQQPPPQLSQETFKAITSAPFHYGFHGTIKPPFKIESSQQLVEISTCLEKFCAGKRKFSLPALQLRFMSNFLCLMPSIPSRQLHEIAAHAVAEFDTFRLPPSDEEIAKRRKADLTTQQDQMLEKWGYPFVMEEFRFHLTLTGKIEDPKLREITGSYAQTIFTPEMCDDVPFEGLSLFIEKDGSPLVQKSFHPFGD